MISARQIPTAAMRWFRYMLAQYNNRNLAGRKSAGIVKGSAMPVRCRLCDGILMALSAAKDRAKGRQQLDISRPDRSKRSTWKALTASTATPPSGHNPLHWGDVTFVRTHQKLRGVRGPRRSDVWFPLEIFSASRTRDGRTCSVASRE